MFLSLIKNINLAVAFLLELVVLLVWGYWGFHTGQGLLLQLFLGLGIPLIAIIIWSIFGAPRSKQRLQGLSLLLLRIIFFGSATIALYTANQPILSIIFTLLFILNFALIYAFHQS